jgi:hypothetical protein
MRLMTQTMSIMKKIALLCLLVSSLLGYMEWGGGNSAFLFQAEYQIFTQNQSGLATFTHPLILIPLLGQLLLCIALIQKSPDWRLVLAAVIGFGILYLLLFFIGVMEMNWKMLLGSLPFILSAIWAIRLFYKKAEQ